MPEECNGKILVTGGSGFIGSHLITALKQMGHTVTNFDLRPSFISDIREIIGDILDVSRIREAVAGHSMVCHLAAKVGVVSCTKDSAGVFETNYTGTLNVIQACKAHNVKHLLFASSSEVYGEPSPGEILTENLTPRPLSVYAKAKFQAEESLRKYSADGRRSTALRYCNIYGPRQRTVFVIPLFIEKALDNRPIPICSDGRQTRTFTYVADAVDGTVKALLREPIRDFQMYNVCATEVREIGYVAGEIIKLAGRGSIQHISYSDADRDPAIEIKNRILSHEKARRELGFTPTYTFSDGLNATFNYYREQRKQSI